MTTLTVGQDQQFARLADAIAASHDGDLVQVQAGTYVDDFSIISTRITIEGVGGMATLVQIAQDPPNGKAILTTTTDVTLRNMEIFGARMGAENYGNGAAIRHENGALVLDNVYFHHNQNGVLAGDNPNSSITVVNSEFAFNGSGTGQTHGIYANQIASLTIRDSYFHDTNMGHEIKSRAYTTLIENNRILTGLNGNDSYNVDLPNGNVAVIRNNVIVQGAYSENSNIIHYGGERQPAPNSSLEIAGNILVNDRDGATLLLNHTGVVASLSGNSTFGLRADELVQGLATVSAMTALASRPAIDTTSRFANPLSISNNGPDTLVLKLSEDAYEGDALFTASLDGTSLGGVHAVTALHARGETQEFVFRGAFGSGAHVLTVTFLNDAYNGTADTDRNLYLDGVSLNGAAFPGAWTPVYGGSASVCLVGAAASPDSPPVTTAPPEPATQVPEPTPAPAPAPSTAGDGPDTLVVNLSEDAYGGNAQFTLSVDGVQIGGVQEVTALRGNGQSQAFTFRGSFGPGVHRVGVSFLNDAYDGAPSLDRNLYVEGIALNGTPYPDASATLFSAGTAGFDVGAAAPAPVGDGPDTLVVNLSEDAYEGHAQFTLSVDGELVGAAQSVTALHSRGESQAFTFKGAFGDGSHTVGISFLNDAYGGSPLLDRNLYVDGITFNGTPLPNAKATLERPDTASFDVEALRPAHDDHAPIDSSILGGFDQAYYLSHNPDVLAAGVDAKSHYDTYGWHEGRDPNAFFDTEGYLATYADVAAAGVNPLEHYLTYGWTEGRDPSTQFDGDAYLAANPDVKAAGLNPLLHYLSYGRAEGREAFADGNWT